MLVIYIHVLKQDKICKNFNWPKPNQKEEGMTEAMVKGIVEAAVVAF